MAKKAILLVVIIFSLILARDPDFTFVAYGDPCHLSLHGNKIVPIIIKQNPKFVICCGDIAGDPNSVADWGPLLSQINPIIQAGIAYFPVYGNHDGPISAYKQVWNSLLAPHVAEYNIQFGGNGPEFYTMEYNNWYFVMRNLRWDEPNNWITSALSAVDTSNHFIVVCNHYPTISAGLKSDGGYYGWNPRKHFELYLPAGVDANLMGDTHLFYKTVREGITYINSSGGGRGLRSYDQSSLLPGDIYFRIHHITRIDVYGRGAVCTVIDTGENVLSVFGMGDTTGLFEIDSTPPSIPLNLTATGISQSEISLSWAQAEDLESGIRIYKVYRNNVQVGESDITSFTDNGLIENNSYTYNVSAVNGSRIEGAKSDPVTAKTWADTVSPVIDTVLSFSDPAKVIVLFSEKVQKAPAENIANYSISGNNGGLSLTVQQATLGSDQRTVTLITETHTEGILYTLTVNNITDISQAGNTIIQNSWKNYQFVLKLYVSLVDYYSVDTPPIVLDEGFIEGARQSTDRSVTQQWTSVPNELSGLTYLLTARDDRDDPADENKVFYRVNCSAPCSVFALVKQSSTPPVWISGDGWQGSSLSLVGNGDAYIVYKKYFTGGDIDLKRDKGNGQGTGYVFKLAGTATVDLKSSFSVSNNAKITVCPNPFNPKTTITFTIVNKSAIEISIYDVHGRRLNVLAHGTFRAGSHSFNWAGTDGKGRTLSSGLYLIKLVCANKILQRKVILLK
jgi:hypothetical protein